MAVQNSIFSDFLSILEKGLGLYNWEKRSSVMPELGYFKNINP